MTPFKAVYGREPPILLKYDTAADSPPSLQTLLAEHNATLQLLRENLNRAQQVMKKNADKATTLPPKFGGSASQSKTGSPLLWTFSYH